MAAAADLRRRAVAEGLGSALLLATVVGSGIMGERLDDPKGQTIECVRQIRDDVRVRVVDLLRTRRWER